MSNIDKVALAKQAALGTKQVIPEFAPPVEMAEPDHQRTSVEIEETTGTPYPTSMDYGTEHWKLSLGGAVRSASFPRILSMHYGAPVTTTPAGGTTSRNHQFLMGNPAPAPLAHSIFVVRKDPNPAIIDLFWDVLGDEFELTVEPNGFVKFKSSAIARMLDDAQADPVIVADLTRRFTFDECLAYISVDGGAETQIKLAGFAYKQSNKVDTDEAILGSRQLNTLSADNRSADVTFSPRETLNVHYRRLLQADPAKVKIRLEALGPIIEGTIKHKLEVVTHACEYVTAPAPVSASSRLKKLDINARARYDDTTSKFVELNVVNTTVAY